MAKDKSDFTQKYEEWLCHKDDLEHGRIKSAVIETSDLVSTIEEDGIKVTKEQLEEAKKLVNGLI